MSSEDPSLSSEQRLPVGYYLDNFELALRTVLQRDMPLFDDEERRRLALFQKAPTAARRLIVRLFTRRPGWHRVSMMTYEEIPETADVCRILTDLALLETYGGADENRLEIAVCLRAAECRMLLKEAGVRPEGKAGDLQRSVAAGIDGVKLSAIDGFVRLTDRDLYRRVMLLFFANRRQDLSDFVIRDIGHQHYESVALSSLRLFRRREDAVCCLAWADWRDQVFRTHEAGDGAAVPTAMAEALRLLEDYPFDGCNDRGRLLLMRPLTTLVREGAVRLEGEKRYEEAITVYDRLLACEISGDFRNYVVQRLLIDLEKVRRPSRALTVTEDALTEISDPILRYDLMKRRLRLAKRVKGYAPPPPKLMTPPERRFEAIRRPTAAGARNRFVSGTDEAYVETAALQRYRETGGYEGFHVENALPGALMAVCFWDIIFMALPGAFLHEFQTGPLDWGGRTFHRRREAAIGERLAEIREDNHVSRALRILSEKEGMANPLFSWHSISADVIARTLHSWPGESLAPCLEALAQDAGGWGRGFPDLLLFDVAGGIIISEVKGPGDKVSVAQALWFDLLLRCGVRAELCLIEEADV